MTALFQSGFGLGECKVDPLTGQVERPDGTSHVSPKAMEVLLCLVAHPEKLVERERLIKTGWGSESGHEEALTRCIAELRHALGDHFDAPQFIQTIPRRGYRLVAPVHIPQSGRADESAMNSEEEGNEDGLWSELKRRNVVRTGLAYVAFSWVIIEASSIVMPIFQGPTWVLRVLVIMAVLGLPVIVALSWSFQITPDGIELDSPASDPASHSHSGPALAHRIDLVIIAALLIAISFLLYREFSGPVAVEPATPQIYKNSIAVLPFLNLSKNTDDEFICDGLAEELLNLLAQMKDIRVAARTASFYYKNKDVAMPAIVNALQVRNIVEGSVQRAGNRLRITVQLIDGETLMHRWSETFDTSLQDLLEIRDRVARKIAGELETVITDRGEEVIRYDRAANSAAYLLYLQARQELRKEHNDETLGSAVGYLEQALEVDSRFAKAHAGLCDAYLSRYIQSGHAQVYFEEGERACHRAATLDAGLSEVHTALGSLYRESGQLDKSMLELSRALEFDPSSHDAVYALARTLKASGDLEGAETRYRQLIELQPGYWHSYNAMGHFLIKQARYSEALEQFERVVELDPDSAVGFNNLGAAHWYLGDYSAAADAYRTSVRLKPSNLALSNIGLADYYAGDYGRAAEMQQQAIVAAPEDFRIWGRLGDARRQNGDAAGADAAYANAIRFASQTVKLNPSGEEALRYLSLYYSHTGDDESAIRTIEQARQVAPESPRVHYFASKVYLGANDEERAFLELEKAAALGYSYQIIKDDPDLAPMRDSGRFQSLLSDAKLHGPT